MILNNLQCEMDFHTKANSQTKWKITLLSANKYVSVYNGGHFLCSLNHCNATRIIASHLKNHWMRFGNDQ